MSLIVYTYAKCTTCRAAVAWLKTHGIKFVERPIRETPPTVAELREMLARQNGQLRRLFNTSGIEYRAQRLAERLPTLTEDEALTLLSRDGRLVKRPFVLGPQVGLLGFDADRWHQALRQGPENLR